MSYLNKMGEFPFIPTNYKQATHEGGFFINGIGMRDLNIFKRKFRFIVKVWSKKSTQKAMLISPMKRLYLKRIEKGGKHGNQYCR